MTEQDVLALIQGAIDFANKDTGVKLTVTTASELGEEGWDSLAHIAVLTELDKRFGGKIADMPEVTAAISVRAILEMLKNHGLVS